MSDTLSTVLPFCKGKVGELGVTVISQGRTCIWNSLFSQKLSHPISEVVDSEILLFYLLSYSLVFVFINMYSSCILMRYLWYVHHALMESG